jgi:hypothetical protein
VALRRRRNGRLVEQPTLAPLYTAPSLEAPLLHGCVSTACVCLFVCVCVSYECVYLLRRAMNGHMQDTDCCTAWSLCTIYA